MIVPAVRYAQHELTRVQIVVMDLCTPGCTEIESVVALLHALRCRWIAIFTGREGIKQVAGTTLIRKNENDSLERLRKFVDEHIGVE